MKNKKQIVTEYSVIVLSDPESFSADDIISSLSGEGTAKLTDIRVINENEWDEIYRKWEADQTSESTKR